MRPNYIYTHDWQEGDLVIFHNQGVWHTITGQLEGSKRLMWQCTMASGTPPQPLNPALRAVSRP
jgi:alpha-ketoglutarate-dependent taurine dioxygenase